MSVFLDKLPCSIPVWFRQHWEDLLHPGIWFGWPCVGRHLNNTIMDEIFTEIMEEKEDVLKIKIYDMIKVQVFKESHKTYDKISQFLQCLIWEISCNFCGLMRKYICSSTYIAAYVHTMNFTIHITYWRKRSLAWKIATHESWNSWKFWINVLLISVLNVERRMPKFEIRY